MGWLRNMWHPLTQQVVRRDPVYYALTVAARPDHNSWLISYPYYTKSIDDGQSTGLLHFDLNVQSFAETGKCANIIQGVVSLSDEDPTNCTILVPGFQRNVQQWYAEHVEKFGPSNGATTGVKYSQWTKEKELKYGRLIPVANKTGTIRIARPEKFHESTPRASGIR